MSITEIRDWLKAKDYIIVGDEAEVFYAETSLNQFGSIGIKPRNEDEYDRLTDFLDANDIEYEGVYDPRIHEDAEDEDWEIWHSLFDPSCDYPCVELMWGEDY